ncbi:MAG: sigma-70 family RNA polymerase sigma factor [Patescibacteria group bacterium]|nr:sigma-70 family RNA polymerase sigma factor [Patescibacteria group bacterium]
MDSSFAKHITQLKRIPRLTIEEEKYLLKKRKEERNEDDARKIAENYLMLVVKIALKYSRCWPNIILEPSDLFHEGYQGLLKAAEKFDYEIGSKFSTYATWWIRQAIILSIYNNLKTIRNHYLVTWQVNLFYRIKNEAAQLGKEISLEEIAEKIGTSAEKMRENMRLVSETRTISTDSPLRKNPDRYNTGVIEDSIPDKKTLNPEKTLRFQQMKEKTREMLLFLTPREEKVLRMHFGIGEKKEYSLKEIGRLFKMSKERIRQIEKRRFENSKRNLPLKETTNHLILIIIYNKRRLKKQSPFTISNIQKLNF